MVCYYLSSSYGLIKGSGVFFTPDSIGSFNFVAAISVWLIPSLILAFPWSLLFYKSRSYVRLPLIIIIISVPPIGLIGFANPISAAGVLFPNTGFIGIVAIIILMIVLADLAKLSSRLILSTLLTISVISNFNYEDPYLPKGWVSINTNYSRIKNEDSEYYQNKDLILKIIQVIKTSQDLKLILLPELVVANWNETTKHLWKNLIKQARKENITILLGTRINLNDEEYITGLVNITSDARPNKEPDQLITDIKSKNPQILLDRVPVPISMWNPLANKPSAKSYLLDSGIYLIPENPRPKPLEVSSTQATTKITTLICYEQLLIWPILHSMIYKPEIIFASSNVWWARDTKIPKIQFQVLKSWSRLFRVPFLSAVNN